MVLDNFRTIELIWDKANKSIIKTIKTASSDTTGRYLSVKILDGGQEVTLDNAKLQLYWEHPNFNTSGTDDFSTVNSGGLFKMTFSEDILTNIGELNAHLILTLADGTITSDGFPIKVFKGTDDGVVVPTNGKGLVEQVAKKIDKGNVTLNDLTQEVKLAMTGGSLPIVGEDAVGTENIKDNSVTKDKTNFIKTEVASTNLINPEEVTSGYTINANTGELMANSLYNISGPIKVEPNQVYNTPYTTNFYEYEADGTYIKLTTTAQLTTSANTGIVRVRITASSSLPMFLNKGDNKTYEPYKERNDFVGLDGLRMTDDMVAQIGEEYPSIEQAKIINDELYNVKPIYRMDTSNSVGGVYWSQSDGIASKTPITNYRSLNDLIPANAGQILKLYNWGAINSETQFAYAAYKSDGTPYIGSSSRINFSAGVYDETENSYTFEIPENTSQIGLSLQYSTDIGYEDAYATVGLSFVEFTPNMKSLVAEQFENKLSTLEVEPDLTAEMFQKGASPKTLTKKIGIISAGQSNIDGRVPEAELPSYLVLPLENVNYSSNYTAGGRTGTFQPSLKRTDLSSLRWGFDLVTYYDLTQVANEEIYVMKWSQGATSIDPTGSNTNHWTAFYEELASIDNSLLYSFESLIRACVQSQGANFDIKAMLWHQGEGDNAREYPIASENYYHNLKYLISYCRGIVGNSRLPFITGTISHKSAQYDPVIEDALKRLADEDPYMYLVDMKNGSLRDAYHFNGVWSEYLGHKMYDCLIDAGVVTGTKIAPTEPAE